MANEQHINCRMFHTMRPDVIEVALRQAARLGTKFVCRDCLKPFDPPMPQPETITMTEVTQADEERADALDDDLGFLMENERAILLEHLAAHRTQALATARAEAEALRALAIEALDLAEGLHESHDYLGTGSNSRLADKEWAEDAAKIKRTRAALSKGPTQ